MNRLEKVYDNFRSAIDVIIHQKLGRHRSCRRPLRCRETQDPGFRDDTRSPGLPPRGRHPDDKHGVTGRGNEYIFHSDGYIVYLSRNSFFPPADPKESIQTIYPKGDITNLCEKASHRWTIPSTLPPLPSPIPPYPNQLLYN
jgi:hypothetical protein